MKTYLRVSFSAGLAVCGSGIGGDEGALLNTEGLCCCMSTSSKETSEIKTDGGTWIILRFTVLSLYPSFK